MRAFYALALCGLLVIGAPHLAAAQVKGTKGEKCESSETKVKHEINKKPYICDKCVFTKCDTSGSQIKNCARVTQWVNCSEPEPEKKKDDKSKRS